MTILSQIYSTLDAAVKDADPDDEEASEGESESND